MVLEGHVVLCVTEPNFLKNFLHPKWGKWVQKRVFWICWKIWALIFSEFSLYRTFILIIVFLHKSHTWEKSGSWDMSQNVLSQSDCRIFKSIISLKQNGERALFFACWYMFMEIKSWLKNFGVGVVKSGCGHSVHGTLKLAVSLEEINRVNWFFWCVSKNSAKSWKLLQ